MNSRANKKKSDPPPQTPAPLAIAGSKANEVAGQIRRRILSGELAQGLRLPSEDVLASESNVSRSTIRDAMRILQLSGFVRRASLRIVVVSQPTDEIAHREVRRALVRHGATLNDVHEAIQALAPVIAALATERATAKDIKELRSILKAQENSRDGLEFSRLFNSFHESIEKMSRNPALILLRGPLRQLVLPPGDFCVDDEILRRIVRRQYRIVEDFESNDAVSASHLMVMQAVDFRDLMIRAGIDFSTRVESLADII